MSVFYLAGSAANLIAGGTMSSSSENSKFPAENVHDTIPGIPFKFNAAAADDQITVDLGSSKQVTFCSVHGHNIDTGVTAIQLRKSSDNFSANDVLVKAMTKATPSFYDASFDETERYWRLKFVGTNGDPISIGEWVLGVHSTLGVSVLQGDKPKLMRPQIRQRSPVGQLYAVNRTIGHQRTFPMEFIGTETEKDEVRDSILIAADWGVEPVVMVPDSNDEIVVHGRVPDMWEYRRMADFGSGVYSFGLDLEEDPFEMEFQ
jgi:hypothetical protein